MDIITDLSSEAVSYLTVIQDICRSKKAAKFIKGDEDAPIWEAFYKLPKDKNKILEAFRLRISEIIWSGNGSKDDAVKQEMFLSTAQQLLIWLQNNFPHLSKDIQNPSLWVTPDYWRTCIKKILYDKPDTRISLVEALHYMPVQIIYALVEKPPKTIYDQRLYQFYISSEDAQEKQRIETLLATDDVKKSDRFWNQVFVMPKSLSAIIDNAEYVKNENDEETEALTEEHKKPENLLGDLKSVALVLLEDNLILLKILNQRSVTIPFLSLFEEELKEIEKVRESRLAELNTDDINKFPLPVFPFVSGYDPEKKADDMQLAGLAFSGGGIRSATFNLGILQKLAELGTLPRFDYLSTVSGGGYIGTWYTSWIYRDGSIKKVIDRLNNKKSANPMAEEVRPIRWLRMFSNYLSPNSSIMSADAWTVGITWLRNTIINQVVLLLILVTLLAAITALYKGWEQLVEKKIVFSSDNVLLVSSIIILVGTFLAGSGMKTYNRKYPPSNIFSVGKYKVLLACLLIGWVVLSAIVVAFLFLSVKSDPLNPHDTYPAKLRLLSYGLFPCLIGMIGIAYIGGYHRRDEKDADKTEYPIKLNLAIFLSSIVASFTGLALISLAWQFIQQLKARDEIMVFVFGIPIILESIAITIVMRMVIMGKYFPDERREWWGRMGAMMHRFMFWWVIITLAALWLPEYFKTMSDCLKDKLLPIAGGWAGIIGAAVKMAYSSTESGDKPATGSQQAKEIFIRIAPYLFMAGFLLIGASVLKAITIAADSPGVLSFVPESSRPAALVFVLAAVTVILSWRVGVNEFSLHDFYKNRLVRAYMGATRRRTDREKTANGFTGFDKDDDIPLASMRAGKYSGPYPLLNTALNATTVSELDRQDRMAESFVFSPLYCGFDFNPTRSSSSTKDNIFNFGYRQTEHYSRKSGPLLGTVMAISGAAVSPNMGYHSSSATSFLLTMFNVRLGRWIGNPRKKTWKNSDPGLGLGYLLSDLIGKSDIDANYVYLSDGGHFDNMGLYELIRRRCTYIVLGDGEQDEDAVCEGLANAIRRCRIDFGVEISLDVNKITEKNKETQLSTAHFVKGTITYPNNEKTGTIIYIKTSMTDSVEADIREYYLRNPKFPQQSTGDQFFDEAQFESYRKLGYNSIKNLEDLSLFIPTPK